MGAEVGALAPADAEQREEPPHRERGQEGEDVGVGEAPDREPAPLEDRAQPGCRVAAEMVQHLVVRAPQERERRDAHHQPPRGRQEAADLGQERELVLDVLERVEEEDGVEGRRPERQPTRVGARERHETAPAT